MNRKDTIKYLLTAIKNKELELDPSKHTEFVLFEVYRSILNQMKTSAQEYQSHGRPELVEKEERAISLVNEYSKSLKVASEEEIVGNVNAKIEELKQKTEGKLNPKVVFKEVDWNKAASEWNASIDTVKATVGKIVKELSSKK